MFARLIIFILIIAGLVSCRLNDNQIRGHIGTGDSSSPSTPDTGSDPPASDPPSSDPDPDPDPPAPVNSLSLQKIQTPVVSSSTVSVTFDFSGDENDNSDLKMHFCSIKVQPGCDPLAGQNITLTKSGGQFQGSINIASVAVTPGDILKYQVVSSDADGITGGNDHGFLIIPIDTAVNRPLVHLHTVELNAKTNAEGEEKVFASARDSSGNIYVAGYTNGFLSEPGGGGQDAMVLKFTSAGSLDADFGNGGIVQLGQVSVANSTSNDSIAAIAIDSADNVFIAGATSSNLGGSNAGFADAFVAKLNATTGSLDSAFGDGDGTDNDGIVQLNATNTADASQVEDVASIVTDSSGSLYLAGHTSSALGGANAGIEDAFIVKLNSSSGLLDSAFGDGDGTDNDGIVQLNANNTGAANSSDHLKGLAIDSGQLYITGFTGSAMGGTLSGVFDAYIAKIDAASGTVDAAFGDGDGTDNDGIVQINASNTAGATGMELPQAILVDGGNLYVAGYTTGGLSGTSGGGWDGFVIKLNFSSGVLDSAFGDGDGADDDGIVQFNASNTGGATSDQNLFSILTDGSGNLFLGGDTQAATGGANAGAKDAMIIKIDSTQGTVDTSFGDGDGTDDDGILQLNANNTAGATGGDTLRSLFIDNNGDLYGFGDANAYLGGALASAGVTDMFAVKFNATSGALDTSFGGGDGAANDGIYQLNTQSTVPNPMGNESIVDMALDGAGNVYILGSAIKLGGANAGSTDGYVAKLNVLTGALDSEFGDGDGNDNDGIVQFNATNTASGSGTETMTSIVLDGSGNIFIGGYTGGDIGGANAGNNDGFIIKIDTTHGNLVTSFGSGDGRDNDGILQLNASYVADASDSDAINVLVHDGAGNLYAGGDSESSMGGAVSSVNGPDVIIVKLNATTGALDAAFGDSDGVDNDGIIQLNPTSLISGNGNFHDRIYDMALDGAGNIYAAGWTSSTTYGGANGGGATDVFVAKFSTTTGALDAAFGDGDGSNDDGIRRLNINGTGDDEAHDLVLDGGGNIFVSGWTTSSLGGVNAGDDDGFVAKFDTVSGDLDAAFGDGDGSDDDGVVQLNATNTADASGEDQINALTLDGSGNVYLSGFSASAMGGANSGSNDAIVVKLNPTSGVLDAAFGDGDGTDDDGIVQLNSTNASSATAIDQFFTIGLTVGGELLMGGITRSKLEDFHSGDNNDDVFLLRLNATSGVFGN